MARSFLCIPTRASSMFCLRPHAHSGQCCTESTFSREGLPTARASIERESALGAVHAVRSQDCKSQKTRGALRGEGRGKPQRASRSAWPCSRMPRGEAAGELSAEDAGEDSDDEPRAVRRPCVMAARGAEGMATNDGMSRCAESSSIVLCPCDVAAAGFSLPRSRTSIIRVFF